MCRNAATGSVPYYLLGFNNYLKPNLNRVIMLHSEHTDGCYQDPEFSTMSLLEYTA